MGRTLARETQVRIRQLNELTSSNSLRNKGGPLMVEESDSSESGSRWVLVGVLSGGGIDCAKLNDQNYTWENKTGKWMRIGAFEKWIATIIFQETEPRRF